MNVTEPTNSVVLNHKPSNAKQGKYLPNVLEHHWATFWEKNNIGAPRTEGQPFTMLIPPPNITGHLHMGHGFQLTLMDTIVRYQRMMGKSVQWIVGTDHAGIATQMVVERQLEAKGQTRKGLGREAFIQEIWKWKNTSGNTITQQMRRMGVTADWDSERFTMDEGFNKAVRHAFIQLYQQGLIYRGKRLVHWDTFFQTAVSDLEVNNKTQSGHLWFIAYPMTHDYGNIKSITIATTRPETMFGDSAIAVHPDDQRYNKLIGQFVTIPLTTTNIPIIADDTVDPEYGSGAVKITPAHDHNDYAMGVRHALPMINILNPNGTLNACVPEEFIGLDRFIARKKLIERLEACQYLTEIREHTSILPYGDRSNTVLEPYLTTQWYMKTDDMAKTALKAALESQTQFTPEYWINTYKHWLDQPQDWCISRQLWWGHRIPAWHDDYENVYVGESEALVREAHNLKDDHALHADNDVLDTWFSSAIWPLEPLGFFDQQAHFKHRYPTDLLVTGFDILFFWVARMSMLGLKFTNEVPFKKLLITGLIRDSKGQKMSKSKGNVLDPLHLIEGVDLDELIRSRTSGLMQPKQLDQITRATKKEFPNGLEGYGADALRLTFCALHNSGQDIRFDMNRLLGFRNFCNKIWNVSHLLEHRLDTYHPISGPTSIYDLWIQKHWNNTLSELHAHLEHNRFDLLTQSLQDWAWGYFCDWYCEMAKILIDRGQPAGESPALHHILKQFDEFLIAAHPLMPFITEELSLFTTKHLGIQRTCLALENYPIAVEVSKDTTPVDLMCELINIVRNIRSMLQIKPNEKLTVYLEASVSIRSFLESEKDMWQSLGKINTIHYHKPDCKTASRCSTTLGEVRVAIDNINPEAERKRLQARLLKLNQEHEKLVHKMNQILYKEKAPLDIQNADTAIYNHQMVELEQYKKLLDEL